MGGYDDTGTSRTTRETNARNAAAAPSGGCRRLGQVMDATDGPSQTGDDHGELEPSQGALPQRIDPERLPVTVVPAATPSKPVRALAFASIVIAGICGGLIGFAFTDLQCDEGCAAAAGLGGVIGAIIGAGGVAIVAVLVLRAMDEWETVKPRDDSNRPPRRTGR